MYIYIYTHTYTPLRNNAYIHIILLCDYTILHPHVLMVLSPAILMAPDGKVKGSPAIPVVGKAQCTLVRVTLGSSRVNHGSSTYLGLGNPLYMGKKQNIIELFFRRVIDFISSFDQQRVRKTP